MTERVTIELDELTSPYLHHHAQQWFTDLSKAAVTLLQVQAKAWEFKQHLAAECARFAGPDVEDLRTVEIEEAQRVAEDWVAQWLSEASRVNTEALTYAYNALGVELAQRNST